ncbi:MAG: ATP12 family protein [Pseudomonadota bacterium]
MKRFYTDVGVAPKGEEGFEVKLDNRVLRTPAKKDLVLPSEALAGEIAAEWQAQSEQVIPASMPFMSLVSTAIDHVSPRRPMIVEEVAAFGGHDLICYWAEDQPDLVAKQQAVWQPLLDWAALTHDARLIVVQGVLPQDQPESALRALHRVVEAHDDFRLTALAAATQATGSLIIGLSLMGGQLSLDEAVQAAQLDELYQAELWGEDHEAKARRQALREEMLAAQRFAALLGSH